MLWSSFHIRPIVHVMKVIKQFIPRSLHSLSLSLSLLCFRWFNACEERPVYRGTQSDAHTHAHDLPPQMGGCYTSPVMSKETIANQNYVDSGPWYPLVAFTTSKSSHPIQFWISCYFCQDRCLFTNKMYYFTLRFDTIPDCLASHVPEDAKQEVLSSSLFCSLHKYWTFSASFFLKYSKRLCPAFYCIGRKLWEVLFFSLSELTSVFTFAPSNTFHSKPVRDENRYRCCIEVYISSISFYVTL
jgi:hypothetical protein